MAEVCARLRFHRAQQGDAAFMRIIIRQLQHPGTIRMTDRILRQGIFDLGKALWRKLISVFLLGQHSFFYKCQQHPADAGPGHPQPDGQIDGAKGL